MEEQSCLDGGKRLEAALMAGALLLGLVVLVRFIVTDIDSEVEATASGATARREVATKKED